MRIGSDFSLNTLVYESTHSQVYRGVRSQLPVVVKVLKVNHLNPERIAWFRREFSLSQTLQTPAALVPSHFEWLPLGPSQPALVMEDGGDSLAQLNLIGNLSLEQFLETAIAIASGLSDIHAAGVVHKDINPSNILWQSETQKLRIIDFGIASVLDQETTAFIHPTLIEGTLPYLAPEQTGRINRPLDYRSDLYALGVTLYELLSGTLPFQANDPLGWIHCHLAQQPQCPGSFPEAISAIILKLLQKNPDDRYQSAKSLAADLQRCRDSYRQVGRLPVFRLAQSEPPQRLVFSQMLYGRDRERQLLQTTFAAAAQGNAQLVLIGGVSGVGKTALVRELFEPVTLQGGVFLAGKYDQTRQVQPYAAFCQALDALAQLLLIEPDAVLHHWRDRVVAAMGSSAQVLVSLVPIWEQIIGAQAPLSPVGWQEGENRIQQALSQCFAALATPEQPLVLFLDDLQWADPASLGLLKALIQPLKHCLILGAYRTNEVETGHPLLTLPTAAHLILTDLSVAEVRQLIADTLKLPTATCSDLAVLVHSKTAGNPFFSREFLQLLWRKRLLAFQQGWTWSLTAIEALNLTDNVISLITSRLEELEPASLTAIQVAACLGDHFDVKTLALCLESGFVATVRQLRPLLQAGFIVPLDPRYKILEESVLATDVQFRFVHDRVQQAAYSTITDLATTHLQIGRALNAQGNAPLFAITNHLNRGAALITAPEALLELAAFNHRAGREAEANAAFTLASAYFEVGIGLYERASQTEGEAYQALVIDAAEAAALIGNFDTMAAWIQVALSQPCAIAIRARLCQIEVMAAVAQNQRSQAIALALELLAELGIHLEPTPNAIAAALQTTTERLHRYTPAAIVALPNQHTPETIAISQLLAAIIPACFNAQPQLLPLVITQLLSLGLEYGNTPLMAFVYSAFGLMNGAQDLDLTRHIEQIALALLDHFDDATTGIRARTLHVVYSFLAHWQAPLHQVYPNLLTVYSLALASGDYEFAGYAVHVYCLSRMVAGVELSAVISDFETYLPVLERLQAGSQAGWQRIWAQAAHNFRTPTDQPWHLAGDWFDEAETLSSLFDNSQATDILIVHMHKAFLAYCWGNYAIAETYLETATPYLGAGIGLPFTAFWFVCEALTLSAQVVPPHQLPSDNATPDPSRIERIAAITQKFEHWGEYSPNFSHRIALLEAEALRRAGQWEEALAAYNRAIDGALELELLHEAAIATELAAQMVLAHGKLRLARMYLAETRLLYGRWGAIAKLKQLEQRYPSLGTPESSTPLTTSPHYYTNPLSNLDALSILKASQALAAAIDLDAFLVRMMDIVLENAGAERGYLCVAHGTSWQILAEATISATGMSVSTTKISLTHVPEADSISSIINYVKRTQNAYRVSPTAIARLGLPVVYQGTLLAVLYLENSSSPDAFSPAQIDILGLLSSQIASSLNNAQLYAQLQNYSQTLEAKVSERTQALRQLNAELERLAMIDGLTQVANRLYFDQVLQDLWQRPEPQAVALLLLDVDCFKQYNDHYGHPAGDRCLIELAQTAQRCLRHDQDLVARYGGEEFVIVLQQSDLTAAVGMAERLLAAIHSLKIEHQTSEISAIVTVSIGVASLIPSETTTPNTLIELADRALYAAKAQGRDRIVAST